MADQAIDVHLVNLTIRNTARGQAEGLLITGERNILSRVSVYGSGDALQVNGPAYITDSLIVGDGDTVLTRGPAFFKNCEIQSRGPFTWTRNTAANRGTVFLNCRFKGTGPEPTVIARAPANGGLRIRTWRSCSSRARSTASARLAGAMSAATRRRRTTGNTTAPTCATGRPWTCAGAIRLEAADHEGRRAGDCELQQSRLGPRRLDPGDQVGARPGTGQSIVKVTSATSIPLNLQRHGVPGFRPRIRSRAACSVAVGWLLMLRTMSPGSRGTSLVAPAARATTMIPRGPRSCGAVAAIR